MNITLRGRSKPRWLLPLFDAPACLVGFLAAAALRYELELLVVPVRSVLATGAIAAAAFVTLALVSHLYRGRHAVGSLDEVLLLIWAGATVGLAMTAPLALMTVRPIPLSLPMTGMGAALSLIVGARLGYRLAHERIVPRHPQLRAIVVGAGDAGQQLVKNLTVDPTSPYDPICFVDDDLRKRHFRVGLVRVEGRVADLPRLVETRRIDRIIIAAPAAGPSLVKRVSRAAAEAGVKAKALPTLAELAGHEDVGLRDLRDLQLSDFLSRHPVSTDLSAVCDLLRGQRVLVTGAGGSIGSELCRQIHTFAPAQLFMLDRDESALHALQLSIDGRGLLQDPGLVLADIRDRDRVQQVFAECRPDIVFHAAALKHLTMLQRYPDEGLKTNVLGTANVLMAARDAGTRTVVNISTDKAADPTSVLGETKRIAEQLVVGVARDSGDRYLSVRFGNVLGSRGSVLTAFAEQIRAGGPVTVTHPDVTRYFMTVEEAVQLVLQASALGEPGDTLILDMGQPVRIADVAHQMITMSGRSVDVEFTGLRPGEKLHEILASESLEPTTHELISRTRVAPLDLADLERTVRVKDGAVVLDLADHLRLLPDQTVGTVLP